MGVPFFFTYHQKRACVYFRWLLSSFLGILKYVQFSDGSLKISGNVLLESSSDQTPSSWSSSILCVIWKEWTFFFLQTHAWSDWMRYVYAPFNIVNMNWASGGVIVVFVLRGGGFCPMFCKFAEHITYFPWWKIVCLCDYVTTTMTKTCFLAVEFRFPRAKIKLSLSGTRQESQRNQEHERLAQCYWSHYE